MLPFGYPVKILMPFLLPYIMNFIYFIKHGKAGPVMFVDCDIIPIRINKTVGNTVYLFKNELWMKQYSNFQVQDGQVVDCNEKGEFFPYAGTGIYYFQEATQFYDNTDGCTTVAQVIKKLLPFGADLDSEVFRFGTLNDIKNDERLI